MSLSTVGRLEHAAMAKTCTNLVSRLINQGFFHTPRFQSYFSPSLGDGKLSKSANDVPGWYGGLPSRLEQMSGCAKLRRSWDATHLGLEPA
mmetsp:Transcript_37268/g.98599  ORF Transcript_37268/g.98599 Transcript_37268/m.98599 type:complete len:91 (+) Transcript_37268:240-512(+)|eukprot:CAMPEP_0115828602 /NCGR_PEP_ID=MMETSP0287-20121206/659_1 /TAXON_ID=412157 /ORGANISM="Chrysochromulina rotalis, Strain UIO044" /LENGTH=90 /DNA_ID=CAMNT_0003281825 /DNA_START=221 /DNA_END=493 /DNA_ORIENTATION=+